MANLVLMKVLSIHTHPPLPDQTIKGASRVTDVLLQAPVVNLADEEDERSVGGTRTWNQ